MPAVKAGVELHCSTQIQGSARQHQASMWSCSKVRVLDLTIAATLGQENLLSDKFAGTRFWVVTCYAVNKTQY